MFLWILLFPTLFILAFKLYDLQCLMSRRDKSETYTRALTCGTYVCIYFAVRLEFPAKYNYLTRRASLLAAPRDYLRLCYRVLMLFCRTTEV